MGILNQRNKNRDPTMNPMLAKPYADQSITG